ncbi:MAG: polyribonucleotide nucleotidyltransferase [Patescibacteria group bacterium]
MVPQPTHQVSMTLSGRPFSLSTGSFVTQANGSVSAALGDTVLLATVTMSDTPRAGCDFFPLMVDFEERYYAAGKIKGSRFIKREGRPSDKAVITARLTDRPLRPLFPDGMYNDVQVIVTALSIDMEVDPGTSCINAASAAIMVSGIPFKGPVGAVRIGLIDGKLVVNPTYEQCRAGDLDLIVAGTMDAITMVEAGAREVPEDMIVKALEMAHGEIKKICAIQIELRDKVKPAPREFTPILPDDAYIKTVADFVTPAMLDTIGGKTKVEFKATFHVVEEKLLEHFKDKIESEEMSAGALSDALHTAVDNRMRENILEKGKRLDGRAVDEVRPLSGFVGVLPRTHGSGLFRRGETQVLTLTTLGSPGSAQTIDSMDEDEERRYIHHYNFPPYSVGEVKPLRGTGRREIGHGNLAERALLPVLPSKDEFPYTMRLVSEVLSCNGSSSMASVCGSTLSLMDAGVPIKSPVSGIAMGLITSKDFDGKKGSYKILSDIQGLEDFSGDMDFKVAGTEKGITALQMDIKVSGVSFTLMGEALAQARKARMQVLENMIAVIASPRKELSKYAPLIMSLRIDPEQIRVVIGKGGETIQKITAECGVEIDIDQEGIVMITAPDQEKGQKAIKWIERLTYVPKVGDEFEGTVVRIMDFGAFVEIVPGKDGLVHISQLDNKRVDRVEDVCKLGDKMRVKLMEIDDKGRLNLSHKALL